MAAFGVADVERAGEQRGDGQEDDDAHDDEGDDTAAAHAGGRYPTRPAI